MEGNFSHRIRDVIAFSREEAMRLGHDYIGTEHLLLGILREGDGIAIRILKNLNVDLGRLKKTVEDTVSTGKETVFGGNIPLTKHAENVLKITQLEAKLYKSDVIGTEHLLLSLLRYDENIAAQIFAQHFSVSYDVVRSTLDNILFGATQAVSAQRSSPSVSTSSASAGRQSTSSHTQSVPMASDIFISYRWADSEYPAGDLYDYLCGQLGEERVFMDVDNIPLGVDFREHLKHVLKECRVVIALIGPDWGHRLRDPVDYVRDELEAALERGIPLIPVFVRGLDKVPANLLPDSLQRLSYINGIRFRGGRDRRGDRNRLMDELQRILDRPKVASTPLPPAAPPPPPAAPPPPPAAPPRSTFRPAAPLPAARSTPASPPEKSAAEKSEEALRAGHVALALGALAGVPHPSLA